MTAGDRAADDLFLLLVGEDDIGCERFELRAESRAADVPNRAPRREVDADPSAVPRAYSIARVAAKRTGSRSSAYPDTWRWLQLHEPRLLDLLGAELDGDAPVGAHRALAGRVDERDDDAVPGRLDRPEQADTEVAQPRGGDRACVVGAPLADEVRAAAEGSDPGRHVRRLAAGPQHDARRGVGARRERLLEADDHIEDEIAEAEDRHRLYDPRMERASSALEDRR